MKLYSTHLVMAILALAGVRPLRAQNYTFKVAECGAYTAYPKGMNTDGTVVGGAQTLNSNRARATRRFQGGDFHDAGRPGQSLHQPVTLPAGV
jgi:hypothetical protein